MTRPRLYVCPRGHALASAEAVERCPAYIHGVRCAAVLVEVDALGRRRPTTAPHEGDPDPMHELPRPVLEHVRTRTEEYIASQPAGRQIDLDTSLKALAVVEVDGQNLLSVAFRLNQEVDEVFQPVELCFTPEDLGVAGIDVVNGIVVIEVD